MKSGVVKMKYCFKCNKSMPDELENCFYCKEKLVDFKYKVIKTLFEIVAYIGLFITMTSCVLIPFVFFVGWLMNLMVTEVKFIQLLDILKQFYTVPFIHNIPLSVFVVIFAMVLIIGLIGICCVNRKMKNIIGLGEENEVCSC